MFGIRLINYVKLNFIKEKRYEYCDTNDLIYKFEIEHQVLASIIPRPTYSTKKIFCETEISPIILHNDINFYHETPTMSTKNGKLSVFEEYESPIVSPLDIVQLQAIDEYNELKNVLSCHYNNNSLNIPNLPDINIKPIESKKEPEQIIKEIKIQPVKKTKRTDYVLVEPIPEKLDEYSQSLISMGFDPALVICVRKMNIRDNDAYRDYHLMWKRETQYIV
ncbi:hypothetical protein MXB_972 [Myxobolus squamalis]|nr:hypothetical protein MXB_972 [Myxobolus squamalis]